MQGISIGEVSEAARNIFQALGALTFIDWANEHLAFLATLTVVALLLLKQKQA